MPSTVDTRALGGNARRLFVATGACDISNMVYWLNHENILFMFIGKPSFNV